MMSDIMSPQQRSERMRRIRSKDTGPELAVRRMLHALGYRYRIHVKELPGVPDLVFPGRRKVIFVHGCFWHSHIGCRDGKIPKTSSNYWKPKLLRTRERDQAHIHQLESLGWSCLIVWECELRDMELMKQKILTFLA